MKFLTIIATTISMAAVSPANAAELIITYYGSVTSGIDHEGEFGTSNTDLFGKRFVATYIFKPSAASYFKSNGISWSDSSPVGSGPLTYANILIGSSSVVLPQSTYSGFSLYPKYNANEIALESLAITERFAGNQLYASFFNTYSTFSNNDFVPIPGNAAYATNDIQGELTYSRQRFEVVNYGNYTQYEGRETYSNFIFKIESLSIISTGAIPEPSTWMMMILGFGIIGYAMRRRTVLRYV